MTGGRVFHSLGALNAAIDELLDGLNARVTKHLNAHQLFGVGGVSALCELLPFRFDRE